MSIAKHCPGSRTMREPTPVYIDCPNCGEEVEVWTHEQMYPCHKCGTPVFREKKPSCIDWCSYAEKCVGSDTYQRLAKKGTE